MTNENFATSEQVIEFWQEAKKVYEDLAPILNEIDVSTNVLMLAMCQALAIYSKLIVEEGMFSREQAYKGVNAYLALSLDSAFQEEIKKELEENGV